MDFPKLHGVSFLCHINGNNVKLSNFLINNVLSRELSINIHVNVHVHVIL